MRFFNLMFELTLWIYGKHFGWYPRSQHGVVIHFTQSNQKFCSPITPQINAFLLQKLSKSWCFNCYISSWALYLIWQRNWYFEILKQVNAIEDYFTKRSWKQQNRDLSFTDMSIGTTQWGVVVINRTEYEVAMFSIITDSR